MNILIKNKYFILNHKYISQSHNVIICRDVTNKTTEDFKYIINIFSSPETIKNILPYIFEIKSENYRDFVEHFIEKNDLYVVFKYHNPSIMQNFLLSNSTTLLDKCEIVDNFFKNLLEIECAFPLTLKYLLLEVENFNISPDKQIYLTHHLYYENFTPNIKEIQILLKFAAILDYIFKSNLAPDIISEYIDDLVNQKYMSISNAYHGFKHIKDEVESKLKSNNLKFTKKKSGKFKSLITFGKANMFELIALLIGGLFISYFLVRSFMYTSEAKLNNYSSTPDTIIKRVSLPENNSSYLPINTSVEVISSSEVIIDNSNN